MKNIFPKAFIGVIIWVGCSCSQDFVDLAPPTTIRQQDYFKTEGDIRSALNGAYGGLRGYYSNFYVMAEVPSDNAEANTGTDVGVGQFDRFSWLATDGTLSGRWNSSYSIIARCNILLEKIEAITMDSQLKDRYRAEAKFIRALIYFNLVQFFGGVPLVLGEIKTEEEAYTFVRSSAAEVYSQIEADLTEAGNVLPARYSGSDIGRATSGAARSLLGKVLLTQRKFEAAAARLKEVVDNAPTYGYALLPNYADVFRANNGNNSEIVFAVQYTRLGTREGSNFSIDFAPVGSGTEIVTGGNPASQNQGTLDLFNAFEAGDVRKSTAIVQYPAGIRPYYTRKFLDQPPTTFESDNDWPVIRYADVLLMYAEVLNELGATLQAEGPLNQVRSRAGLSPKTSLSQSDFRLAVEQERRVELCFEGHRWFDLLRTGRMLPVMTAYAEKYRNAGGFLVRNYQLTPNKVLYPIPFREISINPKLTQNPGY